MPADSFVFETEVVLLLVIVEQTRDTKHSEGVLSASL